MLLYQLLSRLINLAAECIGGVKQLRADVKAVGIKIDGIAEKQAKQGDILERLLAAVEPLPAVGFLFITELEGDIQTGAKSLKMTNSQQATATVQPVDKKGQPAPVDGIPAWASSDATIITVTAAPDGLSAVVAAVGPLGTAKVSVTGDADLGAGVSPIFGELDVTVTQGQAVGMKITLGPASDQGTGPVPVP